MSRRQRGSEESRRVGSRPLAHRSTYAVFYVVTEGEGTEYDYFDQLDKTHVRGAVTMSGACTAGRPVRLAEIRVLPCNVQRASVSRTRRQAAWLADSGADALVLTEVSAEESGDVLARLLAEDGFGVLLPGPSATDRYRVLVACRGAEPTCVDVGVGSMGHRCVAARITFPAGEIGVMGLYVPSRGPNGRRNQDKRMFQERFAAVLPNVQKALDVSGPAVVAGDLNVLEPDHDPRYAVFGQWEYDFYRAFGQARFDDVFRIKEPVRMDYSWFGRPSAEGKRNGYRFDHAFVSRAHRAAVAECRYDHSVRTTGLTDHAALSVTLDLAHSIM